MSGAVPHINGLPAHSGCTPVHTLPLCTLLRWRQRRETTLIRICMETYMMTGSPSRWTTTTKHRMNLSNSCYRKMTRRFPSPRQSHSQQTVHPFPRSLHPRQIQPVCRTRRRSRSNSPRTTRRRVRNDNNDLLFLCLCLYLHPDHLLLLRMKLTVLELTGQYGRRR